MDEFTFNQTYLKNQLYPQIMKSKPNHTNNLRNFIISGEDIVKKVSFYHRGLKNNNKSLIDLRNEENSNNDEKFNQLKRFNNIEFENRLEKIRKTIEETKRELKIEKKKLLDENSNIKKNIYNLSIDVDFMENFEKYYDIENKILKPIIFRKKQHSSIQNDLEEDYEKTCRIKRNAKVCIENGRDQIIRSYKKQGRIQIKN